MLKIVLSTAKQSRNILLLILLFFFFLALYIFLDFEGNTNYTHMINEFGFATTLIHILANILIAVMSSVMVTFSIINYKLTNYEPVGSNAIPFFSFLFGILTFGCTSCVVAFLSAVGISFTPVILPNGNLLWKLIALLLVFFGFLWILYSIEHSKCKIKQ